MTSSATWSDCRIITEVYKTIGDHQIKADIALPPNLQPGKHPLIIAYHGGYLVAGARDLYILMAAWLPAYASSTSAIIVSPDYRLFPSATTSDILSDVEDLWQWIHNALPGVLSTSAPGHEVDLSRTLVQGSSAGGFCAAHLSMNHADSISATILVYPMVACLSPGLSSKPLEQLITDAPFTGQALDEKIEEVRRNGWVSGRCDPEGFLLTLSLIKGEKFSEMFGNDENQDPLHRVRSLKQSLPRMWILHGKDDSGVPADWSIKFADEIAKGKLQSDVILDLIDNEPSDHGFDWSWTMNDEKLTKRLLWLNETWLK